MSHIITPMSILTRKVHCLSHLIKCHIDQIVKKTIIVKRDMSFQPLGAFSQIDQIFNQNGHGS